MKVSIGHFFGKCLWLFLFFCICLNGHVVNGQTATSVYFFSTTYEAQEGNSGNTSVALTVCHSPTTSQTSLFLFTVAGDEGATSVGDFHPKSEAVTIPAGSQCVNVTVFIIGDLIVEPDEIFEVYLSATLPVTVTENLGAATVTIINDDPATSVFFDSTTYEAQEGNSGFTNVALTVCHSPTTYPTSFSLSTVEQTGDEGATSGEDFHLPSELVTIPAGSLCVNVTVFIMGDMIVEPDEMFEVNLSATLPVTVDQSRGTATVTIINDDLATSVFFDPTTYPVQEGNSSFTSVALTVCHSPTTSQTSLSLSTVEQTGDSEATSGEDFLFPSEAVTIPAGSLCVNVTVIIFGDMIFEPDEMFEVNLSADSPVTVDQSRGTATVTIINDEPAPQIHCPTSPVVLFTDGGFATFDINEVNCDGGTLNCSSTSFVIGSHILMCSCDSPGGSDKCDISITVKEMSTPSWAPSTIPTTRTDMMSTKTDLTTENSDFSTSRPYGTETATTTGMFANDTSQTMMPASPTSRPDVTETTNMTGMFTTNTTQTMTTEMFTTNTTQTMTPALSTSRPAVPGTTKMTGMFTTDTTQTMTPVDPCQTLQCDDDANCTSNEGLVKCTCKDGFYGDGTINGTGCTRCPRNVPDEKFGLNCSSPCTCASNAECDSVTGVCSGDACGAPMPTCDKNNLIVTILQDDMDVDEKTAFTLFCTVNLGTTDVTVTWTGPAGAEIQSGIVSRDLTSNLTVSNAGKEDSGTYTCIAQLNKPTETVTSRNDSVNINVRDFPEIDNLRLQEKLSSSLKFIWTVKDKGNDNITCMANYSEVENNNKTSKSCEETSCELSDLSPNTDYIISVVCNNTAGPSNTLRMTSKTLATVPEEVPDLNVADVNSTFITVTLKPVSTDNGPISCYEFVVAERSEVGTDADNDVPFSSVKENSDDGTPYRAVVMNHDEYTAQKTVIIGAEGNQSTCELPRNSRRKRASELVSSQTLTARNDPLTSANNYSIFLRVYVLSTDGKYTYSSSDYEHYQTKPTKEEPSSSGAALAVVLIILIIVIIGIVIAIFFVWRKRSKENYAEQDGEIIALGENGINDQTDSSPGINSGFEITVIQKLDPINIDELGNCILTKHQNSNRIFKQEFMSLLDVNKDATHEAFSHETNYQEKNRYINIFCYDHSRVKLEELEGVEQSDYINANYIDGYKQPNKFIAAQGPKTETLEDHWRMIWEQKTATIIMLARCFEDGGREKCAQYWPDEGSQKFGQFTVHLDSTAECSDYLIRKFRVTKEGEEEGTYRSINQFHYLAWPDHGVPEYPYTLLAFVKRIRQMTPPKPEKGNIIVHCSAGVGRTGTYITIDAMLDRLKEEKTVDIYNFVNSMRLNRRLLVQTEVQYTFIHHAMHEEHLYGHTEIPLADLHQYFRRLRLKTHIDDNSPLHNEFKTAATLPIRITKCIDASKEGNKEKNRTRNYLPYDHNRVLLERLVGDENSTYINASYIKGYERKNMYIATQAPMENTVHDFWRLVWESLTATVIMLTDLEEKGNEMCVKFWPEEEPQTFGNLTVELASENEEEDYTVHNFSLSSTEGVSGRKVTMFRFHGWPEVGTPNCCESVIDLVNVAHEHQQNSEREESPDHSRHPIVVFCHTGVGRTAVWIALSILMERARAEGVVDVFQTVRTLRQQRQHMLHDATQYEFLYQAVLKHLDTFDQYANYR